MYYRFAAVIVSLAVLMLMIEWLASPSIKVQASDWKAEVDPWVLETAKVQSKTEFIVFLSEQADLGPADALETKLEKGIFVFEELTGIANRTQTPVIQELDSIGAEFRSYWIANMIWVRGDSNAVEKLARRSDVAHIYANPAVQFELPVQTTGAAKSLSGVEWNITKVNADDVWALGYTGEGIVIGGQDTGYEWDHPALKNQYRGWNGASADHNYNWHDAIHADDPHTPPGNPCGFDSPVPCADHSHGTHTVGTMVGDDGGSNQIGMAPGAKWIGCRNMEQQWGTPASYAECYQWFVAPTDITNSNPNPALAPHIISNSWYCPPEEGCTDPNILKSVVQNVTSAGILTVHSAGNEGPACETVTHPGAIYAESFSVGATNSNDDIAGFSSRGPVTVDGSGRLKPDVSAPGVSIRSSVLSGGYSFSNGTSMAAPHVAGQAALMISADPALAGRVGKTEILMKMSAVHLTWAQTCGGIPGSMIPNNTYGYGRIDALAAVQLALSMDASVLIPLMNAE